jgi:hypothetical protein
LSGPRFLKPPPLVGDVLLWALCHGIIFAE